MCHGFSTGFMRMAETAGTSLLWEFDIPKENEIECAYLLTVSLKH